MKQILTILFIGFFVSSCQFQDCKNLPSSFQSYKSAISEVKNSTFQIKENVNTSKSSWVEGASYLSCNGATGYFVLKTSKKEYLHQDVPIRIWKNFKNADSFGSYYTKNIKGRYQLKIN